MLTLVDIIRAPKSNVQIGPWKSGKVPNAALPLGRALKYGPSWDWRLVEFDALGEHYRVLILLSEETERFSAVLALDHQKGCLVLCHHELHTSHKLWHCHLIKGNVWETFPNVLRDKNRMVGWPKSGGKRWSEDFPVTKANALSIAAKRYRFEEQGGLC
ncbi:hypothetical protein MU852_16225 [Brevundimonas albigilva]|uniref:hypothetical protein n=1 Tax=Brevundimonas albigilva TaxID=1312364 RepID=UPI00201B4E19|nr:hypothetical protein [Brevundimonas albigilva]UQV18256.1 hypothetical protein MU852_16225 [Brevundimonas albigilva]